MSHLLELKSVSKSHGSGEKRVAALTEVSLAVEPGEMVAVMGPSGCGKSTLLHLIAGLDRPDTGEILLDGKRIDLLDEAGRAHLRRKTLAVVFQFFNLVGNMTVRDNIILPALLAGIKPKQAATLADALIEELGLKALTKRLPAKLSGGEQQRVALGRALINEPDLLLADEPTGNLNSQGAREVLELLGNYHRKGRTVLLVTHDARVAALANRVVHMRDGRIGDETRLTREGDPRTLLRSALSWE